MEMVKQAGLAGIAVEVGGALIIGPEETTCSADEAGVFLVGVKGD